MYIDQDLLTLRLLSRLGGPFLTKGEEELLLASQTLIHRRGLPAQRRDPGIMGCRDAGIVGDILAQGLLAIHRQIREWLVLAVLGRKRLSRLLEMSEIRLGPPIVQPALVVEGRALVVESMADLMADHRTDGAVIERVIGLGVEERPLQDRSGEIQRVL